MESLSSVSKRLWFPLCEDEKIRISRRLIWGLLVSAFLLRLPFVFYPEVIRNDGIEYLRQAISISSGDWTTGKAPPFYPALIALAHLLIRDPEIAAILISVIFSSLLVVPLFYLGKEIFDERVGILSALIVVVHPFLNSYSGSVLTESTYYFLVAMISLVGWYAFRLGRARETVLFGCLVALAYLTRPEGIGFLMVFCLWILFVNPPDRKRKWTKRTGIVLLALFSFLMLSSPYLLQIRKETGRWGITKKFAINLTNTYSGLINTYRGLDNASGGDGSRLIGAFTRNKQIDLLSLVKHPWVVLKKIIFGFFEDLYVFQQGYNPLLFFFLLLAFAFFRSVPISVKANLYLFAYFFFFLGLVLPFLWMTRRYSSQMIPIAIPWAAFGFLQFLKWSSKRFKREGSKKRIEVLLVLVLLVGLYLQGWPTQDRNFRVIQKEVGLWMRSHLPTGQKMMSKMGQESFYAEQAWVRMPEKGYEEILSEARAKRVRYLVVDENIERDSPGFLERSKQGDLKPLFELRRKRRFMIVFEIVQGDTPDSGSVPSRGRRTEQDQKGIPRGHKN